MPESHVYLVTGGADFIGSHLIDRLLSLGLGRVILLDNFNDYYSPAIKQRNVEYLQARYPTRVLDGGLIIVRGSINDEGLLKLIFSKDKVTHIAHLAALAGVRSSTSQTSKYVEVNYSGTLTLLELAASYRIHHFVFASTSSVYGRTNQLPFVESDTCGLPLSPYAATKRAAEMLAHVYFNMHGLNVTILRLFNVYGPRGRPDMMPFKLMRACVDPSAVVDVYDNGEIKRDWTYIDDVIDAFVAALKRPYRYEIVNIGCGTPVKLSVFIQHIEGISGESIAKRAMVSHKSEPSITYCNNSKARKLFNFVPKIGVREGLEKTWQWFRQEYGAASVKG